MAAKDCLASNVVAFFTEFDWAIGRRFGARIANTKCLRIMVSATPSDPTYKSRHTGSRPRFDD